VYIACAAATLPLPPQFEGKGEFETQMGKTLHGCCTVQDRTEFDKIRMRLMKMGFDGEELNDGTVEESVVKTVPALVARTVSSMFPSVFYIH
jgi:hypothetical protein